MAGGSAIPMARVARNDYTMIGRMLDEGALGIIVPMVHTPDWRSRPPTPAACHRTGRARGAGAAPGATATITRSASTRRSSSRSSWRASARSRMPRRSSRRRAWMAAGPARPTSRSRWASSPAMPRTTIATPARWRRSSRRAATPGKIPGLSCSSPEEKMPRRAGLPVPHRWRRYGLHPRRARRGDEDARPLSESSE